MAYDVFINYRRDDTQAMAVVLEKFLHRAFVDLHVFLDYEGIKAEPWPGKLQQALSESALVITLVGPKYLRIHNEHGERRIDEANDWVRQEIESAVEQNKILVPLLVEGATMLSKEAFQRWPKLQQWLDWQAETIDWKTFDADFEKLVGLIEKKLNKQRQPATNGTIGNPLDLYPLPEDIDPRLPDDEDLQLPEDHRPEATPYLGLRYFRRKDAPLFFGRTVEMLKFFEKVMNPSLRIIRLFGNTGVGKSSFLAAGVLPRLEKQHYASYYVRRNKVTGLAQQLSELQLQHDPAKPAVYILDQAEEMFTDPLHAEQQAFVQALTHILQSNPKATVVLGFRSDYLLEMNELLKRILLQQEDLPLLPLGQTALKEAVEGVWKNPVLRRAFDLELETGFAEAVALDLLQTETVSTASILQNRLLKLYEDGRRQRSPKNPTISLRFADYLALKNASSAEESLLEYQLQRLRAEEGQQLPSDKSLLEVLHAFVLDKPTAGTRLLSELPTEQLSVHEALRRVNLLAEVRDTDQALRLSHDLLAPVVRRRYDAILKAENLGLKQENLDLLLRQIRANLPELKFEEARADLNQTMALGIHPELRAPFAFELAYVYLQAGKQQEGDEMASTYAQIEREARNILPPLPKKNLLEWLKRCNPGLYSQLQLRYFPELTSIPGGIFEMGDVWGDSKKNDETVHTAEVGNFQMCTTPITWQQYSLYCLATGLNLPADQGWVRADRPVINVRWYDAVEYANWLSVQYGIRPVYTIDKTIPDPNNKSELDNLKWRISWQPKASGFRMPTEAEWEYAAREGGRKVRFGNGKNIANPAEMNFNASKEFREDYLVAGHYRQQTTPVRQFKPNTFGLHDMSGNVMEWCGDWYGAYPQNATHYYAGPLEGSYRVLRGGCWANSPVGCRVAYRENITPDDHAAIVGFRLVLIP